MSEDPEGGSRRAAGCADDDASAAEPDPAHEAAGGYGEGGGGHAGLPVVDRTRNEQDQHHGFASQARPWGA